MRFAFEQPLLLILYFIVLVIVSCLLDIVLWNLQGQSPTQVVDPRIELNGRQLKSLLDARGVDYTGCVEKQELAELVEKSGAVVRSELSALDQADTGANAKIADPALNFFGIPHFYEEVEETQDSMWLVQVVPEGSEAPLNDYSWRLVCAHLAPFAIRTGVFDCKLGRRLCAGKGWHEPLLLLALPRGTKAKDKVIMQIFQSTRPQAIVSWVRQQLSERVEKLATTEAAYNFLEAESSDLSNQVKVLLVAQLTRPPMFLAALSVKFAGRIRFGLLHVTKGDEDNVKKNLGLSKLPYYLISTPQGNHSYSSGKEEHFDFKSMLLFLRTVQPEANDVVNVSLFLSLMLAFLHSATKRSFLAMAIIFLKHFIFLLDTWLILILTVHQLHVISTPLADFCVRTVRWFSLSQPGLWLRADIQMLGRHPYVFLLSSILFVYFVRKFFLESEDVPQPTFGLYSQE